MGPSNCKLLLFTVLSGNPLYCLLCKFLLLFALLGLENRRNCVYMFDLGYRIVAVC